MAVVETEIQTQFFQHWISFSIAISILSTCSGLSLNLFNYAMFGYSSRLKILIAGNCFLFLMSLSIFIVGVVDPQNIFLVKVLLSITEALSATCISVYFQKRCYRSLNTFQLYFGYLGHVCCTIGVFYLTFKSYIRLVGAIHLILVLLPVVTSLSFLFHVIKIIRILRQGSRTDKQRIYLARLGYLKLVSIVLLISGFIACIQIIDGFGGLNMVAFAAFISDYTELLSVVNKNKETPLVIWIEEKPESKIRILNRRMSSSFKRSNSSTGPEGLDGQQIKKKSSDAVLKIEEGEE